MLMAHCIIPRRMLRKNKIIYSCCLKFGVYIFENIP